MQVSQLIDGALYYPRHLVRLRYIQLRKLGSSAARANLLDGLLSPLAGVGHHHRRAFIRKPTATARAMPEAAPVTSAT